MHNFGRPRQYVSAARLYAMFPLLRFSYERGAYVLRFVGETRGPVLRKDRRRRQQEFLGHDRREGAVDPQLASRPQGSVRRIEAADAPRRGTSSATSTAKPAARRPDTARGADTVRGADSTRGADGTRRLTEGSSPNRRRRQHGRQRPPRPHH
jgi:hypothetical protein